jgi:RNA polymerase sigma-B factor
MDTTVAARPSRIPGGQGDAHRLLVRWRRLRDPADRDALTERFLPLAHSLARRYRPGSDTEDLMQVAAVGLLKALDRYDPERGVAFTSFAVPTILGELRRYFRDHGWALRVLRFGRAPTVQEVAAACDTTAERILETRTAHSAHFADSLDVPIGEDDDTALDHLAVEEPGFAAVESALDFRALLEPLRGRDRLIMLLRFEDELMQREIGACFGLSQMQVSRRIRACVAELGDASRTPA